MRTTVTLDPDVKTLLAEVAYRNGKTFKAALNDAVRAGLAQQPAHAARHLPPQWAVHQLGLPLVDLTKAAALSDELADLESARKMARGA